MKKGKKGSGPVIQKETGQNLTILGTESLGVRGLCCSVETAGRRIVIDPGIALGYRRKGLLPHPVQIAVGSIIRERIVSEVARATHVVFSHYHGDHIPLENPNPFQLSLKDNLAVFRSPRIFAKKSSMENEKMKARADQLVYYLGGDMFVEPGFDDGIISFPCILPHGEDASPLGNVMLTRVRMGQEVFLHASDIQLLSTRSVLAILEISPDTLFVSGPPLYLGRLRPELVRKAWKNATLLAENIRTVIIDHHLFRSEEGLVWLENLNEHARGKVWSGAGYMGLTPHLLESMRSVLYRDITVPENWHAGFFKGMESTEQYLSLAGDRYPWFSYHVLTGHN
jgi:predicted metallo-beta-lactamase superfamily hydrolase